MQTNPQYANMLIKIIEEEELYKFDRSIKRRGTPPTITAEEFAQSVATQDHPSNTNYRNREEMRNGIICIETMPGDSFEKIAGYYGIKLKKLLQYNDKSSSTLDPGQLVFLKKKKSKAARGYEFHRVKAWRYYVQHLTAIRSTAQKSLQVQLPVGRQSADRRRKDLSA